MPYAGDHELEVPAGRVAAACSVTQNEYHRQPADSHHRHPVEHCRGAGWQAVAEAGTGYRRSPEPQSCPAFTQTDWSVPYAGHIHTQAHSSHSCTVVQILPRSPEATAQMRWSIHICTNTCKRSPRYAGQESWRVAAQVQEVRVTNHLHRQVVSMRALCVHS